MAEAQRALAEQLAGQFGRPVTDATLAADRARVLEARQRLDRAERALGNATLTSPVDGVVGSLDLRRGESSVGRSVVVVGDGAARMTIEVPLSLRALVSPGLDAGVGGLGSRRDLPGRVTSVSVVPTSPTGTPTYTATIVVDDPDQTLRGGIRAEAELTLRTAADVLTIPVSAATRTADDTATVEVVTGATATTAEVVAVETGTVGTSHLEVLSGLEAGQLVVLADRRLPLPGGLSQYQALRPGATPTPTPGR